MSTTKKDEYVNVSGDPVELASGRLLAFGAHTSAVDPKDPRDKDLIDTGKLVVRETDKEAN